MTPASKKLILWCIDAELRAFGDDVRRRPPEVDFEGQPTRVPDVRNKHIHDLRAALAELEAVETVRG